MDFRVWAFAITDDPSQPDVATGYVLAETAEEAVRLINDSRVNVYEVPHNVEWPGPEGGRVYFSQQKQP